MPKLKTIALIMSILPFAAQAENPLEMQPVKGHAQPGWVKVSGPEKISDSQLKKHVERIQYSLQGTDVQVGKPAGDEKNCKMIKGNVKICQKD